MKISKATLQILKNFAQINNSIIIDEKNILKTGSGATFNNSKSGVKAVADIPEVLPEVCIWDINKLLSSINMFDVDKLELTFDDYSIILNQDQRTVYIPKGDPEDIPYKVKGTAAGIKNPKIEYNATFAMTNNTIKNIKTASNVFKATEKHLKIDIKDGIGTFKVTNFENTGSDVYTETFEIDCEENYSVIIDLKDFLIMEGDYEVSIVDERLVKLYNNELNLTYQIPALTIKEGGNRR